MWKSEFHSHTKVKFTVEQATKDQRGSSYTLSLTSAIYRVGGQRHALAALHSLKTRYPLHSSRGRPQGRYGCVRKISPPTPTGIRSSDRPACSESLNRLNHPGPQTLTQNNWQNYSFVYFNSSNTVNVKTKYFGPNGSRQAFPEFLRASNFDLLVSFPNFTRPISYIYAILFIIRCQWPRGLRRASAAASVLG